MASDLEALFAGQQATEMTGCSDSELAAQAQRKANELAIELSSVQADLQQARRDVSAMRAAASESAANKQAADSKQDEAQRAEVGSLQAELKIVRSEVLRLKKVLVQRDDELGALKQELSKAQAQHAEGAWSGLLDE